MKVIVAGSSSTTEVVVESDRHRGVKIQVNGGGQSLSVYIDESSASTLAQAIKDAAKVSTK